jgi:hypothetical protein
MRPKISKPNSGTPKSNPKTLFLQSIQTFLTDNLKKCGSGSQEEGGMRLET